MVVVVSWPTSHLASYGPRHETTRGRHSRKWNVTEERKRFHLVIPWGYPSLPLSPTGPGHQMFVSVAGRRYLPTYLLILTVTCPSHFCGLPPQLGGKHKFKSIKFEAHLKVFFSLVRVPWRVGEKLVEAAVKKNLSGELFPPGEVYGNDRSALRNQGSRSGFLEWWTATVRRGKNFSKRLLE